MCAYLTLFIIKPAATLARHRSAPSPTAAPTEALAGTLVVLFICPYSFACHSFSNQIPFNTNCCQPSVAQNFHLPRNFHALTCHSWGIPCGAARRVPAPGKMPGPSLPTTNSLAWMPSYNNNNHNNNNNNNKHTLPAALHTKLQVTTTIFHFNKHHKNEFKKYYEPIAGADLCASALAVA